MLEFVYISFKHMTRNLKRYKKRDKLKPLCLLSTAPKFPFPLLAYVPFQVALLASLLSGS